MKKFQFIGGLTPPCPLLPFKLLSGSLRSISKKNTRNRYYFSKYLAAT